MADFQTGGFQRPKNPGGRRPENADDRISCRATNPLSLNDDLNKVFLDERQAKATTATRLFRNDELLNATKLVAGEFIKSGRAGKLCMWSTGCSSGEEVYSIAMVAAYLFERVGKQPNLEAFGTDINPNRILEGRAGVYKRPSKDAFHQNYWRLLTHYADIDDKMVEMNDLMRSVCRFTLFDMRKRPKKHTFHFIVCNHVLQYYDPPGQRHIIENLVSVLKPGGKLYLEGITEHCLDGSGLEKLEGVPNMFAVATPPSPFRNASRP